MHFSLTCLALTTFLSTPILAAPTSEIFSRDSPQPYSCKTINPKVPERKKAILGAGGNATDIAISIQETSCNFSSVPSEWYPYGDALPDGTKKTGDSANFGLFKNNWKTIRDWCPQFKSVNSADEWNEGAKLNGNEGNPTANDGAAIACQHAQQNGLKGGWWNAQRGCNDNAGTDGTAYRKNIDLIVRYLNQGHLEDDMVISPSLPAC